MGGAGSIQHRHGLLRPALTRPLPRCSLLGGRGRGRRGLHLPGFAARGKPALQRARRPGRKTRRPRSHHSAAASGNGDRAHRLLPDGRGGDAAFGVVRSGCSGIPSREQRNRRRARRFRIAAQSGPDPRQAAAPPARDRRCGRAGILGAVVGETPRQGFAALHSDRYGSRGAGAAHLYQWYDGSTQRSAYAAAGAPRQSPRVRAFARSFSAGGRCLLVAVLPSLYHGTPVLGYRGRFDPEKSFWLMQKYGVRNSFLFPTALKMMMKAVPQPGKRYELSLRSIMSAGESLGETVFEWTREALGVTVNEMFGQTEMNYIVGNSHTLWPAKPGSIGRPYPGHRVACIDDAGDEVPVGELGEVAVLAEGDPVSFLEYWKNPEATRKKIIGGWCRTGDLAKRDADGDFWYQGRSDDMFKSAGYRIGPSEIENCLVKHPAVANCAVVGSPDPERTHIVKAFIVLTAGYEPSAALEAELQQHVRGKLAPYEYPKEIEFIDSLPMTTTGKVQRRVLRLREEERKKGKA